MVYGANETFCRGGITTLWSLSSIYQARDNPLWRLERLRGIHDNAKVLHIERGYWGLNLWKISRLISQQTHVQASSLIMLWFSIIFMECWTEKELGRSREMKRIETALCSKARGRIEEGSCAGEWRVDDVRDEFRSTKARCKLEIRWSSLMHFLDCTFLPKEFKEITEKSCSWYWRNLRPRWGTVTRK